MRTFVCTIFVMILFVSLVKSFAKLPNISNPENIAGAWSCLIDETIYTEIHIIQHYFISYDKYFNLRVMEFRVEDQRILLSNPGGEKVVVIYEVIGKERGKLFLKAEHRTIELKRLEVKADMLKIVQGDENEFKKYSIEFEEKEAAYLNENLRD